MIKYSILILTFISVQFSFSQDESFRSLNALPILNNPAFTGTNANPRLNYGIAITNLGFTSNFVQNYVSYDQRIDVLHGGIGAEIMHSKVLLYQNYQTGFNLNYSFQQNISEKLCLSLGARIEFEHLELNVNDFFGVSNSVDSIHTTTQLNYTIGGLLYGEKFFMGAVYSPLIYQSFSGEVDRVTSFSGSVGYNLTPFKNKELSFTPVLRYAYQDGFQQLIFQASFNTKRVAFGGSYLPRSFATIFVGYQFDRFSIKAVTGINDSPLTTATQSSQEFILQYNFSNTKNSPERSFKINLF
ncbi:MAG: type IX secretion system membrane protein PorP/SprF [Crocinitomix sp.]|nr:type IX secretion system membrane protein PorP/SprF [Crocinitomix sp.]